MRDADPPPSKIPAALIVTGPNIASQDLLFAQLAGDDEAFRGQGGRFVRLRAAEAPNLKAALRKIVREAGSRAVATGDEEEELAVGKDVSRNVLSCILIPILAAVTVVFLHPWVSVTFGVVAAAGLTELTPLVGSKKKVWLCWFLRTIQPCGF